jgi:hypothetical protein
VKSQNEIVKTRKSYQFPWLLTGACIGIISGVLIGGTQFREWENPLTSWGILIISCTVAGGFIGFIAFSALIPSTKNKSYDGTGDAGGDIGYGGYFGGRDDVGGHDGGGDGGGD